MPGHWQLEKKGGGRMLPTMSTVQEIEAAIEKLAPDEFFALVGRLRERHPDAWDRQIEADANSGRLERMIALLEPENRGQLDKPLDEVLDKGQLS